MKKPNKIYAVFSEGGLFAIESEGTWYPVVFTDANKLSKVVDHVQAFSNFANKELTIAEFSSRKDIKVIKPNDK